MEPILWFLACVFFMISIFLFGALIYFTLQRAKIVGIKKEVMFFDKELVKIRKHISIMLREFKLYTKNK